MIDVLIAMNNPDYDNLEKWLYCLESMIVDFDDLPEEYYKDACDALSEFIDMGQGNDSKKVKPKTMDWEQDATMIVSAVNRVQGKEVRSVEYMHWWTFLSAYMEIGGDCLYSQVLNIRQKKAKGKKLDKWEREFYAENKQLIDIKKKLTEEEMEEEKLLTELFG